MNDVGEIYVRGDRVILIRLFDQDSPLRAGTRGTVRAVDGLGTVHVYWDDGSNLGVAPDLGDEIRKLTPAERVEVSEVDRRARS
jgi:hypothetical protein